MFPFALYNPWHRGPINALYLEISKDAHYPNPIPDVELERDLYHDMLGSCDQDCFGKGKKEINTLMDTQKIFIIYYNIIHMH